jgi:hypothetical protein
MDGGCPPPLVEAGFLQKGPHRFVIAETEQPDGRSRSPVRVRVSHPLVLGQRGGSTDNLPESGLDPLVVWTEDRKKLDELARGGLGQ